MSVEKKLAELLSETKLRYRSIPFFREILKLSSLHVNISLSTSEELKTARIVFGLHENRLEINPNFFTAYIRTPEDMLFLLSHEVLHLVLGHLLEGKGLFKKYGKKLSNLAMDMVINQVIYSFMEKHGIEFASLFVHRFYPQGMPCPALFLLPIPENMSASCLKSGRCHELMDLMLENPVPQLERVITHILSHEENHIIEEYVDIGEYSETPAVPAHSRGPSFRRKPLLRTIFRYLEDEYGWGGEFSWEEKRVDLKKSRFKNALQRLIAEMVMEDRGRMEREKRGEGVLPYMSRYDYLLYTAGLRPLIYHKNPVPFEEEKGVTVYVDVSGSEFEHLPYILSAVLSMKEFIAFPVYGFSTHVFPISLKELRKGVFLTTWGTDFDCVAQHMLKKGVKKAVLITDGYSTMSSHLARKIRTSALVLTVLAGSHPVETEVKSFSWKVLRAQWE